MHIYTSISTANYIGSPAKFNLKISETNKKQLCTLYPIDLFEQSYIHFKGNAM